MVCSLATLDSQKLEAIRAFEKKTGRGLLAVSCTDVPAARLEDSEVQKLKELERELGITLVSYK